jgi:hypothetical protein
MNFPFRIYPGRLFEPGFAVLRELFLHTASAWQRSLRGCTKHVLRVNHPGPKTSTIAAVRQFAFQSAAPWKFIRAPGFGDSKVRARAGYGGPS